MTPKYDLVQIEGAVHEPTFKYRFKIISTFIVIIKIIITKLNIGINYMPIKFKLFLLGINIIVLCTL